MTKAPPSPLSSPRGRAPPRPHLPGTGAWSGLGAAVSAAIFGEPPAPRRDRETERGRDPKHARNEARDGPKEAAGEGNRPKGARQRARDTERRERGRERASERASERARSEQGGAQIETAREREDRREGRARGSGPGRPRRCPPAPPGLLAPPWLASSGPQSRPRPPPSFPFPSPSSRRPRGKLRGSSPAGTSAERPPAARPGREGGARGPGTPARAQAAAPAGGAPLGSGLDPEPGLRRCASSEARVAAPDPEPPPPRPLLRPAGLGPAPPGRRGLRDGGRAAGAAQSPGPSLHFAQTCFSKVSAASRLHRPLKVDWGSCGRPPLASGLRPRPVPRFPPREAGGGEGAGE